MNTEEIWGLWTILSPFINKKEHDSAIEELLNYLYELDCVDFQELVMCAENEEENLFAKITKRFIKENELDDEEY